MDASLARRHRYRLADAVFYAGFQGVFPAFCDEQSDGPYLTIFVYNCRHFCAVVDADRTTTDGTRNDADQRKTTQTPHPVARDGSGIPVPRVYKMACVIGSMLVCCVNGKLQLASRRLRVGSLYASCGSGGLLCDIASVLWVAGLRA